MLPRRGMMAIGVAILVCGEAAAATDLMSSVTEQIVEVLRTIEDAKTAKAAVPKLDALADQMLELRERLKNAMNKPAKSRRGPQADHAKRLAEAMDAYAKELERIESIPGAARPLQGFLKKMKPDAETTEALGSAIERALAERAKKAAAKNPHLTPDPNFKGNLVDVWVRTDWREWFPSAKKGDFVQFADRMGDRLRHEVIAIENDSAIIATINEIFGSRDEMCFRMKFAPETQPLPGLGSPDPNVIGTETITVGDRDLTCQVKKDGVLTRW